jgi:hypothetical protein
MSDTSGASPDATLSSHNVMVSGCFGTVHWIVSSELYGILPRDKRDNVLDMTGERKLVPFFVQMVTNLLRQAGCKDPVSSLATDWSLECVEDACPSFGNYVWQVSQGLWDSLPEDQRTQLLQMAKLDVHTFLEHTICQALLAYAARTYKQGE